MLDHFKMSEFECHCCGEVKMNPSFLSRLDAARGVAKIPFVITSGYRCDRHDKEVGGKGNHPQGTAADIACKDSPSRYLILTSLLALGFSRIGIGRDFIHVDQTTGHPHQVIWLY